jgi:hypothetical protein
MNYLFKLQECYLESKVAMLPLMEEFYTIQGEGFHTNCCLFCKNRGVMWVVTGVM